MVTIYRDSVLVNQLSVPVAIRYGDPSMQTLFEQAHAALRRAVEEPVVSLVGRRPTCPGWRCA